MGKSTMSVRLSDDLRSRLVEAADAEGATVTDLVERFIGEGLATQAHPGIVFKPGTSGRRAALAGGPDVDQVVSALRGVSGSEAKRAATVAGHLGIHNRQVALALAYAADHPDEIEARIRANDAALAASERASRERTRLLA